MLDSDPTGNGAAHPAKGGDAETILEVTNIEVIYNHVILVLKGVSLTVPKGAIVALLGGNGAGKTTTLKAISNLLHSDRGEVTKGAIRYLGADVTELDPATLVQRGVIQVMEGRHCFEHLTVEDNLLTGAHLITLDNHHLVETGGKVFDHVHRTDNSGMLLAGHLGAHENAEMTDLGMDDIDDHLAVSLDLINRLIHFVNPVKRLLWRGDVVAGGGKDDNGILEVLQVDRLIFRKTQGALLQLVAHEE
ncbi:MAG: ATP-binding cassette domain-containing protein [Desulfofustis sp. PB-SRB1]|nr:ATP-binding cassette domain-containing protein [Desulfofustis sp. PB-SRB1]